MSVSIISRFAVPDGPPILTRRSYNNIFNLESAEGDIMNDDDGPPRYDSRSDGYDESTAGHRFDPRLQFWCSMGPTR